MLSDPNCTAGFSEGQEKTSTETRTENNYNESGYRSIFSYSILCDRNVTSIEYQLL